MPSHSYEIAEYKVAYFARSSTHKASIFLFEPSGGLARATLLFMDQELTGAQTLTKSDGRLAVYFQMEHFPAVLDLLRNEKPIYLKHLVNSNTGHESAYLITTLEPVGEEEAERVRRIADSGVGSDSQV